MDAVIATSLYIGCIVFGHTLGRRQLLPELVWAIMLRSFVWLIYPALIFHGITTGYTKSALREHLALPFAGFAIMLTGFLFAHLFLRFRHSGSLQQRSTLGAMATMGNYIFLPYPVAMLLWGETAANAVLLTTLGSDLGVWTLGVSFLRRGGGLQLHKLFNPPLVALSLAIAIVYWQVQLPPAVVVVRDYAGLLGMLTVPCAMLMLGYYLAGTRLSPRSLAAFGPILLIQLILVPLVVYCTAVALALPPDIARIVCLIGVMPPAIATVLLSKLYDGDASLAAQGVMLGHIVALLTAPVMLFLLT